MRSHSEPEDVVEAEKHITQGFPRGPAVKNPAANAGDTGLDPWVTKIFWRRKWQPTPVFLLGESHGQKSLAGYSSWGRRVGHDLPAKQQRIILASFLLLGVLG